MSFASEVLADLPMGWWKRDEIVAGTMVDSSGNGHDGSYLGFNGGIVAGDGTLGIRPGIVPGIRGSSVEPINNGAVLPVCTVPDAAWLQQTAGLTVIGWMIPDTLPNAAFIATRAPSSGTSATYQFRLDVGVGGVIRWLIYQSTLQTTIQSAALTPGQLYQFAGTFTPGMMRLYINAVEVANSAARSAMNAGSAQELRIGSASSGTNVFDGPISNVAIYNHELTPARILQQFTIGLIPVGGISLADAMRQKWSGAANPQKSVTQLEKDAMGAALGYTAAQLATKSYQDVRQAYMISLGKTTGSQIDRFNSWLPGTLKSYDDKWADYTDVI